MSATLAQILFAATEFRYTSAVSDSLTKSRNPLAVELTMDTLFQNSGAADSLAFEILALRKSGADWAMNVVRGQLLVEIGDTITVVYPRFGLSAGKNFIVKRIRRDASNQYDQFMLYGPQ